MTSQVLAPPTAPGGKHCPLCKKTKTADEFSYIRDGVGHKYLQAYCKPCTNTLLNEKERIRSQALREVVAESELQTKPLPLPAGDVRLSNNVLLRKQRPAQGFSTLFGGAEELAAYVAITGMAVIATRDKTRFGVLLHLSVSFRDRLPTWEEMAEVRNAFFPTDIDAMMMMPRASDYVNLHEHCLHIIQCPGVWAIR